MSIAAKPLAELTSADIQGLVGADPEPQRIAALRAWSPADAAAAAASLANTGGGLLVVGATADASGRVISLDGAAVSEVELLSSAGDLGPTGSYLGRVRVLDQNGKRLGLLAVAESASPPVLVESTGAIYRRTEAGLVQVRSRADLDQLLVKDRLLRDRAENNIDGMLGRVAFGHFNYMTVAVVAAPRIPTPEPYRWASQNKDALVGGALAFAKRWGLSSANLHISAGEIEIALPDEVTGFVRIARNGCVAAGERQHRPAQDRYLSPQEFSTRLAEIAEIACAPFRETRPGLVLGALFVEGVRDLRLPVEGGLTEPPARDLVQTYLPERFLEAADERAAFARELQSAAGEVFHADLVRGIAQAYGGPVKAASIEPRNWHGLTKRTERRLSGARGHGSAG